MESHASLPMKNRLSASKSPYLLQHASNPVHWHEWGDEAFCQAEKENKPVFLSIGYASCHWCHVMAEESFADQHVADFLNAHFISIKVDREERPDLDDRFMAVCQLQTGSGGWPLTVFLTPDKRPFYACTYIPRSSSYGMPGILEVLDRIRIAWHDQREQVDANCSTLIAELVRSGRPIPGYQNDFNAVISAWEYLQRTIDPEWGGFALSPKFPTPYKLQFLTRVAYRLKDADAQKYLRLTLDTVMRGGIRDHLGGGYHRYAVDRQWQVPHFEKMLYDQALLSYAQLDAYQLTASTHYLSEVEDTFEYLLRDLVHPDGAFFSSEDADCDEGEGAFYLWTESEFIELLGKREGLMAARYWGVKSPGNFENKSVLNRFHPDETLCDEFHISSEELGVNARRWKDLLLQTRSARLRPNRDEKILTQWNGLAIGALAKAYTVTGCQRWLDAALNAWHWILNNHMRDDGRFFRSWFDGSAGIPGLLDDYAALLWAATELHQATLDASFSERATALVAEMIRLFPHPTGAFSPVAYDSERIEYDFIQANDNLIPPANALFAASLHRLARITSDDHYLFLANNITAAFSGNIKRTPAAHLSLLMASEDLWSPSPLVTLIGGSRTDQFQWMQSIAQNFVPGLTIRAVEAETPLYGHICLTTSCSSDTEDLKELIAMLHEISGGFK